jgi:hypothetical protein
MKKFFEQSVLASIFRANKIILFSCITLALIELIYILPTFLSTKPQYTEIILLALFTLGFYSFFGYFITLVTDIVIFCSFITLNIKRYYITISVILFTLLNYIPFHVILKYTTGISETFNIVIILLALFLSVIAAIIITFIICHAYIEMKNNARENIWFISGIFIIIVVISLHIIKSNFMYNYIILSYYLLLLLFLLAVVFINIFILNNRDKLDKLNYVYLNLPIIIIIMITAGLFPKYENLEAFIKQDTIFDKSIIRLTAKVLDIDRDGFYPEYIVGGSDQDNFDSNIHPLIKDKPENGRDENNFAGDLILKNSIKNQYKIPETLTDYNIFLILANNTVFEDIDEKNSPFLINILYKGVYFPNVYSLSNDKLLTINGLLSSNINNIKLLQRAKPIIEINETLPVKLKTAGHKINAYIDIPYNYNEDIFNLINTIDIFYSNNYPLENPVNMEMMLDDLASSGDVKYTNIMFVGASMSKVFDKRLKKIYQRLEKAGKLHKTLFVIAFLPEITMKNTEELSPLKTPVLFYYEKIKPAVIKEAISLNDITPTILSLMGIKYNNQGYIGSSKAEYLFSQFADDSFIFSIDPHLRRTDILYKDYKLIYWIKDGIQELYDLKKDPDMKYNLINKHLPYEKVLKEKLDFYLSNGYKLKKD